MKISKKVIFIILVVLGWMLFARTIYQGVLLRAKNDIAFRMINVPGIEPTVVHLNFKNDTTLILGNILFTVKRKNGFYSLRWVAYKIKTKINKWISIEPLPTLPLDVDNYSPNSTLFIPSKALEQNRYQIKIINDSTIVLRDNVRNTERRYQHSFEITGMKIGFDFDPANETARFEFLTPPRLFTIPSTIKKLYLGNYNAYFQFSHLMPRYVYPYDFYADIRELCNKGAISFDSVRIRLKIEVPKERNLLRVFNRTFKIDTVNGQRVIRWTRYARFLSDKKDPKDPFYGRFSERFLDPWQIVNNRVLGLKSSYLAVDISLGKFFTNILAYIKDRNGNNLFSGEKPIQPSLWNLLPPSLIGTYLEDAIIQRDLSSQIAYFFKNKPYREVTLSLDLRLQNLLSESIERFDEEYTSNRAKRYFRRHFELDSPHVGAVLLSENGEILAAVSYPFPKNYQEFYKFTLSESFRSPRNSPAFNRVWKEVYPIGSTIKPFVAAIALEQGIFIQRDGRFYVPDPNNRNRILIDKRGFIDRVLNRRIKPLKNYRSYRYPFPIQIRDFLIRSINVASVSLVCRFPSPQVDRMLGYFDHPEIFLLKNKSFVNIPTTYQKSIENPFWAEGGFIGYKETHNLSVLSRLSIGDQVYSSILYLTSLFASLGENKKMLPTLLPVSKPDMAMIELEPVFDQRVIERVKEFLKGVVENRHGTAFNAFMRNTQLRNLVENNRIEIWGKTGTAEVGTGLREHKLFVCSFWFPQYEGRYYLGIIVENAAGLYPFNPAAKIAAMFIEQMAQEFGI